MSARSDPPTINQHLPPHLREVCDLLARGLLRLRSRVVGKTPRHVTDHGEGPLHFPAPQRLHANRPHRRDA